jgi:hypothetical protein
MMESATLLRRHAKRLLAIVLILGTFGFARLPEVSDAERAMLAERFAFVRSALPMPGTPAVRNVRDVHPGLAHFAAWISAVGAGVALADLDGDGLANDVCYVDPRSDRVVIAPAPGTPARYRAFVLHPTGLAFDPATTAPMGCLPGDLNEDGLMDVLVYYWGRTPIAFLRQAGAAGAAALGPGAYVARDLLPTVERWYTNAATFADVDGDGHVDVVVGNYFADDSRVLDARATTPVRMQRSMSRARNGGGLRILRWKTASAGAAPTVQFVPVQIDLGQAAHGWTLAVGAADLDGDLLPEIYVANDFGPDHLLHNRSTPGDIRLVVVEGRKTLTVPNSKVLGRDSFKGMGVDFGDLNGDGLLDIVVSNITSEYGLLESNFAFVSTGEPQRLRSGSAPYVDRSESLGLSRSGWAWDVKLADFDNDGTIEVLQAKGFLKGQTNRWPELHELAMSNDELVSHPRTWLRVRPGDDLSGHEGNSFFVRARSGRYVDIAGALGLGDPQVTRGIAVADVDGDGRLDFAVANQWNASYLYRNTSPRPGAFLGLHVVLAVGSRGATVSSVRPGHPGADTPGRPAIGATAVVTLPTGRRLVGQVDGGSGHSGKRSPDLHFGLGELPTQVQLTTELRWRDAAGRPHRDILTLAPGWSTIVLGDPRVRP